MFGLCQGMKWTHLPNAGGLYDQDPELLDKFAIIFHELAVHEDEERKKEKAEREKQEKANKRTASRMPRGGGRRRR